MNVRSLVGVGWDELAAGFDEAFSDYLVPMAMTAPALEAMQRRRGYVPEASFGAFDGGRLVGFVLTCLDGGGHFTPLECPQRFAEAVLAAT